MHPLILASSSPYKKMLLERLNIAFSCYSPDIDEAPKVLESPLALAERLSQEKALAVARLFPNTVIIGADQVEDLDGEILGKPGNHEQAIKQLSAQFENYLRADHPYDCAGSFKAEALGISLFTAVHSNDPSALIGLPLIDCCSLLAEFGLNIP